MRARFRNVSITRRCRDKVTASNVGIAREAAVTRRVLNPAFSLLFVVLISPSVRSQSAPAVVVAGDVSAPLHLTAMDLGNMPRGKVAFHANGVETVYEGVWLSDVLKKAGVPIGPELRGNALAAYVLASASDGYRVLFSVGEIDPDVTDNQYLLADRMNDKPLPEGDGPFRLVLPKDKRGVRSVRLLTKIEVVQLKK